MLLDLFNSLSILSVTLNESELLIGNVGNLTKTDLVSAKLDTNTHIRAQVIGYIVETSTPSTSHFEDVQILQALHRIKFCGHVMVELETESFILILIFEILEELSIVIQNCISIVHSFPLSLWIEVAHHVVDESPKELPWPFALVEEPIIYIVV